MKPLFNPSAPKPFAPPEARAEPVAAPPSSAIPPVAEPAAAMALAASDQKPHRGETASLGADRLKIARIARAG